MVDAIEPSTTRRALFDPRGHPGALPARLAIRWRLWHGRSLRRRSGTPPAPGMAGVANSLAVRARSFTGTKRPGRASIPPPRPVHARQPFRSVDLFQLALNVGELSFDAAELLCRPLDLRSGEPLPGAQQPVPAGEEEDHTDRHGGIVEVVAVDGVKGHLGEEEEHGDERHPDDPEPTHQRAPAPERPATALPTLPL